MREVPAESVREPGRAPVSRRQRLTSGLGTVVLIALAVVTYQLRLSAWRVFAVVVLIRLGYLAVLGVRTLVRTRS